MAKLADILGKTSAAPAIGAPEPDEDDMASGDSGPNPEEIDAMKMFERAKTTEQKAEAMKAFIEACMPQAY